MATAAKQGAVDKRRLILDAARPRVRPRGFHHCRVSDVADEAGVAYGLVYHYFRSKEEILNTLFLERWQIMLDAIAEIDARDLPAREKLHAVASFIIDSYRHDPDLMKVIIVEVTRAANSFGALHLDKIREAYEGIAGIVEVGPRGGLVQVRHPRRVRRHVLLRRDRAAAHRLDLRGCCRGPTRSTSGPRASWSRRSAAASSRRRTAAPGRLLESAAHAERPGKAPDVERPARRSRRAHLDRREPDRDRDLDAGLQGGPAATDGRRSAQPRRGSQPGRRRVTVRSVRRR